MNPRNCNKIIQSKYRSMLYKKNIYLKNNGLGDSMKTENNKLWKESVSFLPIYIHYKSVSRNKSDGIVSSLKTMP